MNTIVNKIAFKKGKSAIKYSSAHTYYHLMVNNKRVKDTFVYRLYGNANSFCLHHIYDIRLNNDKITIFKTLLEAKHALITYLLNEKVLT